MSTLSPKGRALVRAGRCAFRPTDADRLRLLGALGYRLGTLPCRPTWARYRPQPRWTEPRWRGRALPTESVGTWDLTHPRPPLASSRWLGAKSTFSVRSRSWRGVQSGRPR